MHITVMARAFDQVVGGVERMATALMNEMVARGHRVSLITLDPATATSFYAMVPDITWHKLDLGDPGQKAGWPTRFKRLWRIRKLARQEKSDVIIGFQDAAFLSAKLAILGTGIPVIAAERNAPTRFDFTSQGKYRQLRFNSFRLASRITIQCESYRDLYPAYLHNKIVTIPNPVYPATEKADPAENGTSTKTLLSIGRLGYQKNYECLIEAFAQLAHTYPDWRMQIVGEGENRAALEAMIATYQLQDRIDMPGAFSDVAPFYTGAQLFCLPSRWEGFPNALAEAMAHGLPGVGFAECAGMRDLIRDGDNGRLARGNGNAKSLSLVLGELMNDHEKRQTLGRQACQDMQCYTPDTIFDQWETLLQEVA